MTSSVSVSAHCDSIAYSSVSERLAVATSNLTGPVWDGGLMILEGSSSSSDGDRKSLTTAAGNTDVSWFGDKGDFIVCSCDDGSLQIWSAKKENTMVRYMGEHDDIVTSVSVHPIERDLILSGSWDMSIKLWPANSNTSSSTLTGHTSYVWDVEWNKKAADIFFSTSQDKSLKTWDRRATTSCTATIRADFAVFCAAWNPRDEHILALGEENGTVRIIDTRKPSEPVLVHSVHKAAVRRIEFNPHDENTLASVSDDATARVWNWQSNSQVYVGTHKDFVRGLSWNPHKEKHFATASWDKNLTFHNFSS